MNYIVQKFGGTSIGKADRMMEVAKIVKESLERSRIVVVLSAMSTYVKAEGTTSRLIEAAQTAICKGPYYRIVDALEESHLATVEVMISGDEKGLIIDSVKSEIKSLKSFLDAISVIGELTPRSHDVIISTGEKLSACIFAGLLNSLGIDAEYVNLEDLIDRPFHETSPDFFAYAQKRLGEILSQCGHKVPVLTGYFGIVPNGIVQAIGRGYTDVTAALCSATLQAAELQIWKEVDGVYSADPRKVENAQVLPTITPEEAAELTYYGSEVIHPFTMEHVIRANVPIRIKNTFHPHVPGTIIDPNINEASPAKPATAVTVKRDITVLNINSNRMLMAYGFMAKVFNILAKYGIVIDLISTSEVNISMTIENTDNLHKALPELEAHGNVSTKENMAILSLVGRGQQHCVGLSGKLFSVLGNEHINIEMISQGASEINISCVIEDEYADKAVRAVHNALIMQT